MDRIGDEAMRIARGVPRAPIAAAATRLLLRVLLFAAGVVVAYLLLSLSGHRAYAADSGHRAYAADGQGPAGVIQLSTPMRALPGGAPTAVPIRASLPAPARNLAAQVPVAPPPNVATTVAKVATPITNAIHTAANIAAPVTGLTRPTLDTAAPRTVVTAPATAAPRPAGGAAGRGGPAGFAPVRRVSTQDANGALFTTGAVSGVAAQFTAAAPLPDFGWSAPHGRLDLRSAYRGANSTAVTSPLRSSPLGPPPPEHGLPFSASDTGTSGADSVHWGLPGRSGWQPYLHTIRGSPPADVPCAGRSIAAHRLPG